MTVVFETAAVRAARGKPVADGAELFVGLLASVKAVVEQVADEVNRCVETVCKVADTCVAAIQTEVDGLDACPPGSTEYRRRLHRIATAARELRRISPPPLRRALTRLIAAAFDAAALCQCAVNPRPVRRLRLLTRSTACLSRGPPQSAVVRPLSSSLPSQHSFVRSQRKGKGAVSRVT